jgi:glucokinase
MVESTLMASHVIAVDLGGTQLRAALIDSNANILLREEVKTEAQAGPEIVMGQIETLVTAIAKQSTGHEIIGVGISSPGPLDTTQGIALSLPTISGFTEYPIGAELSSRLPYPIRLENDGIAAAIGEWKFGAGVGFANVVFVTVSTGIGGGVIVDGHVMRGRRGMAGHVGHMAIVPDGLRCNCGSTGCIEAYAAGPAFTARAQQRAALESTSLRGNCDSRDVFAAAKLGDALALNLVREEAHYLGMGFTSLLHLYSPDVLIMGGGLSNEFGMLHPLIDAYVQDNAMAAFKQVPIVQAKLGGNAGLVGASRLVFDAI